MSFDFQSLVTLCTTAAGAPLSGAVILGLFLAGAAGSVMHCVPMCGPFVLGQVADRMARLPVAHFCEWRRVGGGALLPYHLGRLTTYAGLGALAASGGAALGRLPWLGWLPGALLLLGAALFLAQGLRRLTPTLARAMPGLERAPAGWSRLITRLTRGIDRNRPTGGYLLGLVLGFLPCGFLYAALATTAASANPVLGALGMLAFGLGTVPALVAVGVAGHAAGQRWQRCVAVLSPVVMLVNAGLLAMLAVRSFAMAA